MSERDHTDADHTDRDRTDTLLATLLRDEAELASSGIQPPELEDLRRRAASRSRRPWIVAGALLAAATVAALVWANLPSTDAEVGPAGEFVPPADGPIVSTFPVPTYAWDEGGGDAAQVSGVLALTDAGCPMLVADGRATALLLPNATGVTYDNGVRGVVDAEGRVYAVEGQQLEYAGGWQEPAAGEFAEGWQALCGDTPARDVIYVNSVAAHEALTEAPALPPEDLPTAPTTAEELGWFPVPTFEFGGDAWPTSEAGLIEGVVEFTDDGCPYVETDGVRTGLVFPNAEGFQAPGTDDPRLIYASFPEQGSTGMMAEEGQPIFWGGGGRAADDEHWTAVCQDSPVDAVFIVQDTPFG